MEGSLLIDISRLMGRTGDGRLPTGVDRVCLAYLSHFGARAQAVLQSHGWRRIMPYRESQELFRLLLERGPHFLRDARLTLTRAYLPPWPSQDGAGRISINPGHSGLDDLGMPPWMRRTRQRPVFVVHDLIPLTHPEYCRAGERERHIARLEGLLGAGAGLVTNSQATLDELEKFARARGLPLPPAVAAPLAPADLPRTAASTPPLAQPYFVVLGTIEPRKNHLLLLHLWRDLARRLGEQAPQLVVIGQRGWECENVVDVLERCEGLRGLVHELPGCSDVALARYLRHAQALLFPSFVEGYGMPLVEALTQGTPVIASALPVFREIAGDVPDYLDPLDGPGWSEAILDYAQPGSPRRAAQLQRMDGFEAPTWQRHFELVEGLLERLR
jgi:glycosyltransferase involved in cell wall biosynthesis